MTTTVKSASDIADFTGQAIKVDQLISSAGTPINLTDITPMRSDTATGTVGVSAGSAGVGTLATPASGTLSVVHTRYGPFVSSAFTMTAMSVTHTDDTTNGSSGSQLLLTFPEGSIRFLGSRLDITAIAIGTTCVTTTAVGAWGVGTVAIAASADGALATTSVDIVASTAITLSGGTGAGTTHTVPTIIKDGTTTPIRMYLEESHTAATSSSTGVLSVTGTLTVLWAHVGDD